MEVYLTDDLDTDLRESFVGYVDYTIFVKLFHSQDTLTESHHRKLFLQKQHLLVYILYGNRRYATTNKTDTIMRNNASITGSWAPETISTA